MSEISDMELKLDEIARETLLDPMYKKIDSNGKVYLDKRMAGREVLVIAIKPVPEDKIRYIKVGR